MPKGISYIFLHLFSACRSKKRCNMGRQIDLMCHFFLDVLKRLVHGLLVKLVRWYEANLLVFYKLFLLKHLMKTLTKWQHDEDQKQPLLWQFWHSQTILRLWTLSVKKRHGHFPHGVWLCQYRLYRSKKTKPDLMKATRRRYHSLILAYSRR